MSKSLFEQYLMLLDLPNVPSHQSKLRRWWILSNIGQKCFQNMHTPVFTNLISFRQSQVWDAMSTKKSNFPYEPKSFQSAKWWIKSMASRQSVLQNIPNMLKMKGIDETEINVSKFLARKFTWNNLPHYCISEKKIK